MGPLRVRVTRSLKPDALNPQQETRNYLNNAPNKPLHDLYEQIFGTGPQG